MDLQITGQNVEVLPPIRTHIQKKLEKLERHLPNLTGVKIELADQKTRSREKRYRAQITLEANGTLLRAEERAGNLLAAVDNVVPELDRQIEKYKGKLYKKSRAGIAVRAREASAIEEEGAPRIVRRKRFPLELMKPEEAVDQMELLGHTFFLFHNSETGELNLVYKRTDGDYSIIEPVWGR